MEEREGFVENSKVAIKGTINGILGSFIYETIIMLFFMVLINLIVSRNNPTLVGEELSKLADEKWNSFPFSILIMCISSIVTLAVSISIIKFDKFKELCKKAFSKKTLVYGALGLLSILMFSYIYSFILMAFFGVEGNSSSNQDGVVELIKSSYLLGFLAVVVLAPIVEELTYRYFLFGIASKKNKLLGYIIAGGFFALMHFVSSVSSYGFSKELLIDFIYLPPYLFSGLVLCYVYDKTNNIGSSLIAHTLNNLLAFLGVILLVIGL